MEPGGDPFQTGTYGGAWEGRGPYAGDGPRPRVDIGSHPTIGVARKLVENGFDPQTALKAALQAWLARSRPQTPGWPSLSGYGANGEGWQAQVANGGPDPYLQDYEQGQAYGY